MPRRLPFGSKGREGKGKEREWKKIKKREREREGGYARAYQLVQNKWGWKLWRIRCVPVCHDNGRDVSWVSRTTWLSAPWDGVSIPPFPWNGRVYLRYPVNFANGERGEIGGCWFAFFLGNWMRRMGRGRGERERREDELERDLEIVGISMVKIVGMTRGWEELRIIKRDFKLSSSPLPRLSFFFGDLYGEINRKF